MYIDAAYVQIGNTGKLELVNAKDKNNRLTLQVGKFSGG